MLNVTLRRGILNSFKRFNKENIVWTVPKPDLKPAQYPVIDGESELLKVVEDSLYEPEEIAVYDVFKSELKTEEIELSNDEIINIDQGPVFDIKQVGTAHLHPSIFCAPVDQSIIYKALEWQNSYKTVDMSFEQSRMETGQKRYSKPWQGSGMGFERVRDKTGPMFKGGAFTDEPRRPFISNFHMIDRSIRLKALISCLTVKNLQNDIIILQSYRPQNIARVARALNTKNETELSYILLYKDSNYPAPIENWVRGKKYYNLFPLEGLNVKALLKYDKIIMDLEAVEKLEAKLLFEICRYDFLESHNEPEHPTLNKFWSDVMTDWKDEKFNLGGYKSGHHKFYKDWPETF